MYNKTLCALGMGFWITYAKEDVDFTFSMLSNSMILIYDLDYNFILKIGKIL